MFLSGLLSGGETIKGVADAASTVAEIFTTSDREQLSQYSAETKRLEVSQQERLAQVEVNRVEASHPSVYVAGWRPNIGWACSAGVWLYFVVFPITSTVLNSIEFGTLVLADVDWRELSVLTGALLGVGALRTFEKTKNVARNNMKG